MRVTILEAPLRPGRWLARWSTILGGTLLVSVGLAGCTFATFILILDVFVAFAVVTGVTGYEEVSLGPFLLLSTPLLLGGITTCVVGLRHGRRVFRGQRRLALFVRHFGFKDATDAVTRSVKTAMGARWRVVTLDDSATLAVGASTVARWSFHAGAVMGVIVPLVSVAWLFGGGPERFAYSFLGVAGPIATADTVFDAIVRIVLFALFFGYVAFFAWRATSAIRAANRSRVLTVAENEHVDPCVQGLTRSSQQVFAPRLIVVKVAGLIWRRVVARIEENCAVVIADVSRSSENLLWEIETLAADPHPPWLFIGEKQHLDRLSAAAAAEGGAESLDQRLVRLLQSREVLAYCSEREEDLRRFSGGLHDRLELL